MLSDDYHPGKLQEMRGKLGCPNLPKQQGTVIRSVVWDDWAEWPPNPSSPSSVTWEWELSWSWSPRSRRRSRKKTILGAADNAVPPSQDLVAGCWADLPEAAQQTLIKAGYKPSPTLDKPAGLAEPMTDSEHAEAVKLLYQNADKDTKRFLDTSLCHEYVSPHASFVSYAHNRGRSYGHIAPNFPNR